MKNPKLMKSTSEKIAKATTDGILRVVGKIAKSEGLTSFDDVYNFIINLSPHDFATYEYKPEKICDEPITIGDGIEFTKEEAEELAKSLK